jgi:predicted transcriptional regulator of viral defense system
MTREGTKFGVRSPVSGRALLPLRLREAIPQEEFDYPALMHALAAYASPRDKATALIEQGIIIRVKKGVYVFGSLLRRRPFSREVLANLLYGPSYLSLEYALQHHGLIPEGIETATSVTTGRSRQFVTPVGTFSYAMIPLKAFQTGADLVQSGVDVSFFMATPEKALADKLALQRGLRLTDEADMRKYLIEDLRVPENELRRLDANRMRRIEASYGLRRVTLLTQVVVRSRRPKGRR